MDHGNARSKCRAGASRLQRMVGRHFGWLERRNLLAPVLWPGQALGTGDDSRDRAQNAWRQWTNHPRLLGHDGVWGTEAVRRCRLEATPRVVGGIAEDEEQLHARCREHAGAPLDQCSAHPLALGLREHGQRREDGSGNIARGTGKSHLGEQDVPDRLACLEGKQGQAWLSRGVLQQRAHQVRFIVARKGRAFHARHGIGVGRTCFNDTHDALVFQ